MKLRNKLIPIISAATVAATIAPISSCAIGQTTVDLINGYTPSIKKAVWEDYKANKDDMLSFYASAVNENPDIFAQDMYWKYCVDSFYNGDYVDAYYSESKTTQKTMEALVSNVAVRKLTCLYTDEETEERKEINYYTISFDFQFHWAFETKDNWGSDFDYDSDYNLKLSVKNIPITINREGTKVKRTGTRGDDYNPMFTFYEWRTWEPQETKSGGTAWVLDDDEWTDEDAFAAGYLPTSWIIQPIVNENAKDPTQEYSLELGSIDHEAFTRLENNGYEWYVKWNSVETTTYTYYYMQQPRTEVSEINHEFKEDSQFDNAAKDQGSLDFFIADWLFSFYLPSHYLSDIEDVNEQLWCL